MEYDAKKMAPHVDDIVRALENRVEKQKIEEELENYVSTYRVGLDVAKRSIVKKYGGKPSALAAGTRKKLSELVANEPAVEIMCRLLTVNRKSIDVQGQQKEIVYGLATDGTETLPYTAWEAEKFPFAKGDVISVAYAYTGMKEWNGKPQINFGGRAVIEIEPKDSLPDSGAQLSSQIHQSPPRKCTVAELMSDMRNVSVCVRILSIEKREISVKGEKKEVFSGTLGDSTGIMLFTAWNDFNLKKDQAVRISFAYVTEYRGVPQLNFDANCKVEHINDVELPKSEMIADGSPPVEIHRLACRKGGLAVAVTGIVADIRIGSGLIFRCPECKRATNKGECKIHGRIEDGVPDLRTKAVIDDGTGTVTAILNRELTEKILGKTLNDCIAEAKRVMNPEVVYEQLASKIVATRMQVRGNATSDDFGLTLIATAIEDAKYDCISEAKTMLDELENGGV